MTWSNVNGANSMDKLMRLNLMKGAVEKPRKARLLNVTNVENLLLEKVF